MSNIKINGRTIPSKNDIIKFNSVVETMEFEYKNIENLANNIANISTYSTEGTSIIETVWDNIISFFRSLCQFIGNIFRSKVYSATAGKLADKISKMRSKDAELDNRLDWFKKMVLTKDILIPIHEVESLLDETPDDSEDIQNRRITRNLKKDVVSSNAFKMIKEMQDRSNGTYEATVGEALYVLSKNDKGAPIIKSEDPTERLDLLVKYLNCYRNNSTSRMKALMRINSKCNRRLGWAIKHKERKLDNEETIDAYRLSVKINNLCLNICIKSAKNVFYATNILLKNVYKKPKHAS